jgi:hypothetical protein
MGNQINRFAVIQKFPQRWQDGGHAGGVADDAVMHGHIQIGAHHNAFQGFRDVFQG